MGLNRWLIIECLFNSVEEMMRQLTFNFLPPKGKLTVNNFFLNLRNNIFFNFNFLYVEHKKALI